MARTVNRNSLSNLSYCVLLKPHTFQAKKYSNSAEKNKDEKCEMRKKIKRQNKDNIR